MSELNWAEMNALIDKAEKEGKWLWCRYQDLWFSPAELRKEQANGNFRWGAVNWELRDPQDGLAELEHDVALAEGEVAAFKLRMAK